MKHFQNHLSTMEELWWLSLWKSPLHVQYECLFYAPSWRPVDWQFEIQGVAIDLEIKYRRFDWLRFVDPVAYEHAGLVFPNAGGQVSGPSCRAGQPRRHDAAWVTRCAVASPGRVFSGVTSNGGRLLVLERCEAGFAGLRMRVASVM